MSTHGEDTTAMATMKAATLWSDPRTGIWTLRRRVPKQYLGVAQQRSGIVKLSSGTADRKAAEKKMPDLLRRWDALVDGWEAALHVVALDHRTATEIADGWAAAVTAGTVVLDPSLSPAL